MPFRNRLGREKDAIPVGAESSVLESFSVLVLCMGVSDVLHGIPLIFSLLSRTMFGTFGASFRRRSILVLPRVPTSLCACRPNTLRLMWVLQQNSRDAWSHKLGISMMSRAVPAL